MPITPTTIFFEDYFDSASPLDAYDPFYWDPLDTRLLTDDRFLHRPGEGPSAEGCMRWIPASFNCPGCSVNCGTGGANCQYARQLVRKVNGGGFNQWRHLRCWIRPHGNWLTGGSSTSSILGILMNNPSGVIGEEPWSYFNATVEAQGVVEISHASTPTLLTVTVDCPFDEWTCIELARRHTVADGSAGEAKAWVNDELVLDGVWAQTASPVGLTNSVGFHAGPWGSGQPIGPDKWIDFARVAWADGPIGCGTRAGLPPGDPPPDPDAKMCRDDDYDTDCIVKGECGRIIFKSHGLTREAAGWETLGNGFPSEQSAWFSWTAPRSGRFIWRTRGSEVFNEISVHKHTGAFPPPTLAFADEDAFDPTASTSSAVEVTVEKDVEYRIRIASAANGWIIVDWGPAKPLVQDDGWSIPEQGARQTLTRVEAVGPASGFAVQDGQIATNPSGAGTDVTLGPVVFG